jgi:hypothetical protein
VPARWNQIGLITPLVPRLHEMFEGIAFAWMGRRIDGNLSSL